MFTQEQTHTVSRLLKQAEALAAGTAEQVILVQTAAGEVLYCLNRDVSRPEDEDGFLAQIREHGQLEWIVCMWRGGGVDLPSCHFRKGLLDLCPENGNARMVLRTDAADGPAYNARAVRDSF